MTRIALVVAVAVAIASLSPLSIAGLGLAVVTVFLVTQSWAYVNSSERLLSQHSLSVELLQRRLSEDRHAVDLLADGLDVAIFVCDRKAIVQYANRHALEMFRFTNPANRSLLAITLSYDLEALVFELFRKELPIHAELTFSYPEERVNVASAWLEDGGNRMFLAIYEITDLRRLERVRRDFVANVSHELRTPLATIRAMAETLHDDPASDQALQTRYLAKIVSEVDRLSLITNDLLILSAAESNPVRKHACDLAETLRAAVLQLERKAKDKGLKLTYEGPETMVIEANSAQMTQVALNLIDNAINYTLEGDVAVSLSATSLDAVFVVRDTGIGIASQYLSRIFERFYRIDKGRSRITGGTGLGLSIVKHIVESHGGTVGVESALNHGSSFTVSLPMGDASPTPIHEA